MIATARKEEVTGGWRKRCD